MSPTRDAFSVTRKDEAEPPPRTPISSETRLTGPASFATDEDIESIFASLSYLLDGDGANDSTPPDVPGCKASAPPPARSTPAPAQEVIHIDDSWLEEGPAAVTMRMPADYPARITVRPSRLDVPAAARPSRPGFLSSRQREVVTPLIATLTAAASAAMPSTATAAPHVSSPCATLRDSAPPSRPSAKLLLPPRKLVPRPRALPPKPQPPPMKAFALPPRPPPFPMRLPLLPLPPMPPGHAPAPPTVDTSVMPMNASSASWPLVAPPVPQPPPARQPGARASRIFGLTAIAGAVLTAGVCLAMLLHVRSLQAPGTALAPSPSPNAVSVVLAPPPAAPAPAPTLPRVAELPPQAAPAAPAAPAALAAPAAPVAPAAPATPTAPAPTATTSPASPKVRTMPRSLPSEPFVPAPWVAEPPRMVAVPPPPAAPPPSSPAPPAAPAQKPASAAIPSTGPVLFDDR